MFEIKVSSLKSEQKVVFLDELGKIILNIRVGEEHTQRLLEKYGDDKTESVKIQELCDMQDEDLLEVLKEILNKEREEQAEKSKKEDGVDQKKWSESVAAKTGEYVRGGIFVCRTP